MECPKAAMFDLDETLAESFQPASQTILERLSRLSRILPFAIISGAGIERIDDEVLSRLSDTDFSHIYAMPNSSAQCFVYREGAWTPEYDMVLSDEERAQIKEALARAAQELDIIKETKVYGQNIIDRRAQIATTFVGLEAPQDIKMAWDPDHAKRAVIQKYLQTLLPEYNVLIGGASTIDITKKEVSKAHGVAWLASRLGCTPADMFYVGDTLYPGGNDSMVVPTGIQTRQVSGPKETERIIDELLATCENTSR